MPINQKIKIMTIKNMIENKINMIAMTRISRESRRLEKMRVIKMTKMKCFQLIKLGYKIVRTPNLLFQSLLRLGKDLPIQRRQPLVNFIFLYKKIKRN
jgi:hypothetical protein